MKNAAFDNADDEYYTQDKEFLLHMVPKGANVVLDLGCGSGRVGKRLLESNRAARVIGVEIFEAAAAEATQCYATVHVGDIESMDLGYNKEFDIVICGDILEHLRQPSVVVGWLHRWLKDDGKLVCCVPNVRYWRIWIDLALRGNWRYTNEGIMDQTHLRFFTTRSFRQLLEEASFKVYEEDMRIAVGPRQELFNRLTSGIFKEFLGIQMMFAARKA